MVGSANNSDQYPIQKITHKGIVTEALVLYPYGMYGNVANNTLSITMAIGGSEETKVTIPVAHERPDDLEQGEVAYFHPKTMSKVVFRNNGNVEISTKDDAKVIMNISGDADITANKVNVDATQVNLGVGGQPIARLGDTVEVDVIGGSSAGKHTGTITAGGTNTSI